MRRHRQRPPPTSAGQQTWKKAALLPPFLGLSARGPVRTQLFMRVTYPFGGPGSCSSGKEGNKENEGRILKAPCAGKMNKMPTFRYTAEKSGNAKEKEVIKG